jgi:hypothetical protein
MYFTLLGGHGFSAFAIGVLFTLLTARSVSLRALSILLKLEGEQQKLSEIVQIPMGYVVAYGTKSPYLRSD